MKCPRCEQENPPQAKFCLECATPLALRCTNCGTQLPAGAKFCFECATPVGGSALAPRFVSPETYTPKHLAERIINSKAALEGERKQVTVLFADLKGSMELLADRDPEEARRLLDPVLEHMMEGVHRYEGTVNQVMGDGIMALFGAPLAHEDHAVRACYAALRMQQSVKKYAEEARRSHAAVVKIRVGLNSGEVVVRAIGSDLHMDYTAVGQTTHLAARMEQIADPGAIVITPDTLALAEGYVEVKSLGPVPVKGLADPVEVYEVTGAGPARTRLQAAALRGLTRFVGRHADLEHLRRAQRLAAGGHGQVAAVVGEAGVGKSRLVYEFTHSHRLEGWLILESSSVSYGKATSYLPVIDLLKGYFKIQDRDELREIREKITGKLLTLDESLKPTISALFALLNVPVDDAAWQTLDPSDRRRRTLDAVKRLLLREAREQPVVLIFEDLHWIDGETQALLDNLVDSLASARLLLLVNYRPEYQHGWSSKTAYSQLRLDALPPEGSGELLEALLGEDPGLIPLKQLLVRRGNPFFLEETVRTLVETKVLDGSRGRYRLMQPIQALQVPPTVHVMLAARIDRLGAEDKRLLQVASVIGKDVPFALLQAIAGPPDEALLGELDRLQAAEFLYETRLFPDLQYAFKHALTHEVTYGTLLQERRRELHAAVVEAIERSYADRLGEQTERLAHHAVRGEVWQKAMTYLHQAGQNARVRSAYRQAATFLEQALETLKRLPDTSENAALGIDLLCHDLWDPLMTLTQYQRLLDHLQRAAVLAEKVGDHGRWAEVLARTISPFRNLGQHDRAVEAGERALALASEAGDVRLRALAGMELGQAHSSGGASARAEILFNQVLAVLDSSPAGTTGPEMDWMRRLTRERLVLVLASIGRYEEAARHGEEALRMAEDLGHPAPLAGSLYRLGWVYCGRGELDKAIDLFSQALALAREREVDIVVPLASAGLGAACTLTGRTDEAVILLEEAVGAGESTKSRDPFALVLLGQAYLSAGRLADASSCAQRAVIGCREQTRRNVEAHVLQLIGDIASRQEPLALGDALQNYRQALALADELGMRPLVAHCHLGLGKLYRRTDKREQARENLAIATTMYREMGMVYWLEQAEAEISGLM